MIKSIFIITSMLMLTLNSDSFSKVLQIDSLETIPIYSCKEISKNGKVTNVVIIDTVIFIKKGIPIQEKAELIAHTVSKRFFQNLKIKIPVIDFDSVGLCLKIDLIENENFDPTKRPSWYQFFQGSYGGAWTSEILISNFLQKQYVGKWVDKIKFYYQGEEFEEWEHIWLGEHIRYNLNKN